MADEMEAPLPVATPRDDIYGVADQAVHRIVGRVSEVWSRAVRIAALAWCHRAKSSHRERRDLGAPHVERFGKAVQQQHERSVVRAIDICVEHKVGTGLNLTSFSHRHTLTCSSPGIEPANYPAAIAASSLRATMKGVEFSVCIGLAATVAVSHGDRPWAPSLRRLQSSYYA